MISTRNHSRSLVKYFTFSFYCISCFLFKYNAVYGWSHHFHPVKQFRSYSDFGSPCRKKITGLERKCMSIHSNKNALTATIHQKGDDIVFVDNDVGDDFIQKNINHINPSWIRLSEFLIQNKNLVEDKNVAIVGKGWISSVVHQLQLDSESVQVVQYQALGEENNDDDDDDDTGNQVLSPLEINMSFLSPEVRDKFLTSSQTKSSSPSNGSQVETKEVDNLWENGDDAVVILATSSNSLVEDPFVNDYLRRTSSKILMDRDMVVDFCYHPRIQEGADIILW